MRYREIAAELATTGQRTLSEVASGDLYPKSFEAFRQKYLPLASRTDLYVNFNDHVGNIDDKSFSNAVNHGDPWGLYAYPLEYVLNHPADIFYGQQARFLRVLQDTSTHKLVVTRMTETEAIDLLWAMGLANPQATFAAMRGAVSKRESILTGNKAAKLFFTAMQRMAAKMAPTSPGYNKAQTALLRKAGIDCIEDVAGSAGEATIYPDEPEQIIFLQRSAFRVIGTFELRNEKAGRLQTADRTENLRRLPALIVQAIGDRLVAANTVGDRAEQQTYYTAAKRRIILRLPYVFNWKKTHRENGTASPEDIHLSLSGPDFATISATYDHHKSFADIAADVAKRFRDRQPAKGQGYSITSEYGPDIAHAIDALAAVAAKLKLPFTREMTPKTAQLVYKTLRLIEAKKGVFKGKADYVERGVKRVVNEFWRVQKLRAPQADQIIAMYEKLAATKRITFRWDHGGASMPLAAIMQQLGIADNVRKSGVSSLRRYADGFAIGRQGTDLIFVIDGKSHRVAHIENGLLDNFNLDTLDPRILDHAADIADYCNEQGFTVEGYATYLPERLGVVFDDGHWATLNEAATVLATLSNGIAIYKLPNPNRDGFYVCAREPIERPKTGNGPSTSGQKMLVLFGLNSQDQIEFIPSEIRQSIERGEKKPQWAWPGEPENVGAWAKVVAGGFDLRDFVKQQGYGFGPYLNDEDVALFGLKRNRDTGKLGKTDAEVMEPVGEFLGEPVFSLVAKNESGYGGRQYLVRNGKDLKILFVTGLDAFHGKDNTVVRRVAGDLSPVQRKVAKAVIASLGLTIPRKFAPLLGRQ